MKKELLMKNLLIVLVTVSVLTLVACTKGEKLTGKAAPEFSLTTLDGAEISLGGFRGRPVVLYFFASW
jgi:cytochrome c biogenesis protein CcmG/thiol:disulfide interchange protein DsbE